MFRPFSQTLKAMRPYFIGVTFTITINQTKPYIYPNKPPPLFTPSFSSAINASHRANQSQSESPNWRVTNYFFNFPCGGLALYHWFNRNRDVDISVSYEKSQTLETFLVPPAMQRLDVPACQPTLPAGFVSLNFAIDALIRAVNPDCSRLWCQQLLLADLAQRLVVLKYGKTYICKKSRVEGMVWRAWWQNWKVGENWSDTDATLVEEEDSDDESIGSLDWRPFIQE